nr:MAG TPA: hypothetical protein [Caudoviricetes sp.]
MAWGSTFSFLSPPARGAMRPRVSTRCNSAGPRQNGLIIPQSWMTGRRSATSAKAGSRSRKRGRM